MIVEVLIQTDREGARTERVHAPDGRITIGRHSSCTLRLDGDSLSRQHVVVTAGPDGMRIEDTSSNGTVVGDKLFRREAGDVPWGSVIHLGQYRLTLTPTARASVPPSRSKSAAPPSARVVAETAPAPAPNPGSARLPSVHPPPLAVPASVARAEPRPKSAPPPLPAGSAPNLGGGSVRISQKFEIAAPASGPPLGRESDEVRLDRGSVPAPRSSQVVPNVSSVPSQRVSAGIPVDIVVEGDVMDEVTLRREIHRVLLENLDLATIDAQKLDDPSMRPRVLIALRRIVKQFDPRIPAGVDRDELVGELADEALGLGPLERFLADPTISEVMVIDPRTIFVERNGKLEKTDARFTDDDRVRAVIERIVTPLGRRIDESSPLVDARLKDGSRVNAVIKPIALRGSCITIRKFSSAPLTLENLMAFGALSQAMGRFLTRSVVAKKNVVISGGTGSGKTTLLNVLSGAIPSDERIVTIEDAAELRLHQPHIVSMETRPSNMEGRGEYTIRDLVKNALRMRPDRIVVGECRGGEALDMLQAMNTGHDGSLTTTHANSPTEALARLETLVLMGGLDLPSRAIREQIASSLHLVVQQTRLSDGSRKVTSISEVVGIESDGEIVLRPIFEFVRTGTGEKGAVLGEFRATGYLPSFLETFIVMGLVKPGEPYL
ncbi:MAG: ATPase, T2SS/T4P/T4SS family [Polyangiaceae bacterium]